MIWPLFRFWAEICQIFHWFFGKFKNIRKTFWNYLTFSRGTQSGHFGICRNISSHNLKPALDCLNTQCHKLKNHGLINILNWFFSLLTYCDIIRQPLVLIGNSRNYLSKSGLTFWWRFYIINLSWKTKNKDN